jgi:AcrR family transcriptional regulator
MQKSLFCRLCKNRGSVLAMTLAAPPISHRERKKLATRQSIHNAAFDLVYRHGLSGTTIEIICERAGVAPRTFWAYFASKEDAVVNRDPEQPAVLRNALLARPADEDPFTALRAVLETYISGRLDHADKAIRRHELIRREPSLMVAVAAQFDDIERALVAAVADRLGLDVDADLLPSVLVMAACGACKVAVQRWADRKGEMSFDDLFDAALTRLAEGLAPLVAERGGKGRP